MTWSTRQLADLAGTTLKTVRYYHQVDLLPEPERGANGYKHYGVSHLVRLLRIKRLTDLGVPLSQIAVMDEAETHPEEALRVLDAELEASIERLQRVRAELAVILRHRAPTDLPAGFGQVAADLSDADRALLLVYSRVVDATTMDSLRQMLHDYRRTPAGAEFDILPADADDDARQDLAERFAPDVRALRTKHPWLNDVRTAATQRPAVAGQTIGQAVSDLYNSAQVDVMRRVHLILEDERAPGSPVP